MLDLIKLSLWNTGEAKADEHVYEEMKKHAILALPAPVFSKIALSAKLKSKWKADILDHVTRYSTYEYVQSRLPLTVPYVILKGTAAAKYYPCPEYRTMGDIDIMTSREDFDCVYKSLLEDDFSVLEESEREIVFEKFGIVVELHQFFASLNEPEQSKYLDDLILANINPSHVLPDPINGLVLLEHISQHMEHGLGLRQIIDWMMFVDKCLSDEEWPAFREMAERIGMDRLAVYTTRMCEIYLGLPERKWCEDADSAVCEQLMDYVLASGNFGSNIVEDLDLSEYVMTKARTPRAALNLLQERGLENWEAAHKHRFLQPFAWIYQAGRYLTKGLRQKDAINQLRTAHEVAKKRNEMFDTLGVKLTAKGLVVYRDGKYVKK